MFVGIIVEYNPFHNGHAAQLAAVRAAGADCIAVAMSAGAVQRGEVPILPESVRVRAALASGADLVVALPAPYACAGAEAFAAAGVRLLAALEDEDMMGDVNAIHLGDGSTLAMDYLDRFTVEMPYGAENYGRLMQILVIAVSQLETNQTGTIRLNPDGEYQARFMPGQRWEG